MIHYEIQWRTRGDWQKYTRDCHQYYATEIKEEALQELIYAKTLPGEPDQIYEWRVVEVTHIVRVVE